MKNLTTEDVIAAKEANPGYLIMISVSFSFTMSVIMCFEWIIPSVKEQSQGSLYQRITSLEQSVRELKQQLQ